MKMQAKPYQRVDEYQHMMRGLAEPWRMFDMDMEPAREIRGDRRCDWTPAASILETEHSVMVFVELPGMSLRDLEISVQKRILQVTGHRPIPQGFQRYLFMEGKFGWFCRSFTLMDTVDPKGMDVAMSDGILRISVPKV